MKEGTKTASHTLFGCEGVAAHCKKIKIVTDENDIQDRED